MTKNKKQSPRRNHIRFTVGTGNVFADVGVKNPREALIKSQIAIVIANLIRDLRLPQAHVAEKLGIDQPKVSLLMRGHLRDFSIERLFRFVNALEQDIKIVISPHKKSAGNKNRVLIETAA